MGKRRPSPDTQSPPWYHEGLRFECTQCGDCCTGEPGFVWVDDAEIAALAARLGLEIDAFEAQYVRTVAGHKSLIEYANGDCVFFDGQTRGCTVYEDRPIQCRTWPFWDSNLQDRSSWRETCHVCPGSGQGPLYPLAEIEVRRRQREV